MNEDGSRPPQARLEHIQVGDQGAFHVVREAPECGEGAVVVHVELDGAYLECVWRTPPSPKRRPQRPLFEPCLAAGVRGRSESEVPQGPTRLDNSSKFDFDGWPRAPPEGAPPPPRLRASEHHEDEDEDDLEA